MKGGGCDKDLRVLNGFDGLSPVRNTCCDSNVMVTCWTLRKDFDEGNNPNCENGANQDQC